MPEFNNIPVARKLALAFALTTAIALLLSTFFFIMNTWLSEKKSATAELQAIADLIGINSTAALAFDDTEGAREILTSLSAVPDVMLAVLYDKEGNEFVRFNPADSKESSDPSAILALKSSEPADNKIVVSSTINLDGKSIGTVILYGTLQSRIAQLRDDILTAVIATVFSFAVALLVAWRLQRAITIPVQELTGFLQRVSREHKYSARTNMNRNDELGTLAKGINNMLEQVEIRDKQLEEHRHELEAEIDRRTNELEVANEKLKEELLERERYQDELKKVYKDLEKHHQQIYLLSDMNERIQVCHSLEETHPVITYYLRQLFPDSSGALYMINESHSSVEALVRWGDPLPDDAPFTQADCWSLRQGKIHVVRDPENELVCNHCKDSADGPYLCVPMIAYGDVMGLLHIQFKAGATDIPDSLQQFSLNASEQLGLALANLKLHEALIAQSVRDPLTGLYNRRFMQESLERELVQTHRTGNKVGIIMLDIDHFKNFNDTHGHAAGDTVLQNVSNFLQDTIRSFDIVCRYGGEEFIIILPDIEEDTLMQRAEEIRKGISRLEIQHRNKKLDNLTVSLGVSLSPKHGSSMDELINVADAALYKAKNSGRDCVKMASRDDRKLSSTIS